MPDQVQNLPPIPAALAKPKNNWLLYFLANLSLMAGGMGGVAAGSWLFHNTVGPDTAYVLSFSFSWAALTTLIAPRGETLMPVLYPVSEFLTERVNSLTPVGKRSRKSLTVHVDSDLDGENRFFLVRRGDDVLVSSRLVRYASPKTLDYILIRGSFLGTLTPPWLWIASMFLLGIGLGAGEHYIRQFWPVLVVLFFVSLFLYFPLKERQDKKREALDIEAMHLVGDLNASIEAIWILSACDRNASRYPSRLPPPESRIAALQSAFEAARV